MNGFVQVSASSLFGENDRGGSPANLILAYCPSAEAVDRLVSSCFTL